MSCMTHMISFWCGKSRINGREKIGTMMPCTTHVISFLYDKSHINSQKNIGTMMPFFLLHPTSVEVAKTFINDLRSSATGNQLRLECVCTPPAVARARSSSFRISSKARRSHSSPSETAPRWSSSNLAADASSTYSMEHTATTKQPSSYNFFPLLMHINENITHRSTTSQTNIGMITMQFSRSHGQPLQKPQEMQQMLRIFVCRSLVFHKHDAMSDICHFILLWKCPHKWDKTARYHDAVYDTW